MAITGWACDTVFSLKRNTVPVWVCSVRPRCHPPAPALGLGSGQVDNSISFLASKDARKLHFDFNLIELLSGRQFAPGVDHNTGFALATWFPVMQRMSGVVEPYGYTTLNQSGPAFTSAMVGFNYKVQPRSYLDGGLDVGVTHYAPKKRVYVGITYAIANLYSLVKSR